MTHSISFKQNKRSYRVSGKRSIKSFYTKDFLREMSVSKN